MLGIPLLSVSLVDILTIGSVIIDLKSYIRTETPYTLAEADNRKCERRTVPDARRKVLAVFVQHCFTYQTSLIRVQPNPTTQSLFSAFYNQQSYP